MVSSTHEHRDYVRTRKFEASEDGGVARAAVEADWSPRGFSLTEIAQLPSAALIMDRQPHDKLLVVAEGAVECLVGDALPWTLRPGDEVFIPEGTPLQARSANEEPFKLYVGMA